jgi:tRNA wybutosine-synthesizing protein 3
MDKFVKRKNDVLSKLDKSHKTSWDEKIIKLCNEINSLDDYYTTSSCSGRVILMIEQDKKAENLFVSVYHDKISLKRLKEDLAIAIKQNKNIKFKLEPCILHISCKILEDAEKIYNKAKFAGWKKSGIIGTRNGFSVELNGTDRLEFPIIRKGKILVDDEFLKIVVDESNKKLEKSWMKIKKLEKAIK